MEFPKPELTPLNLPFWNGLAEGRLLYQHCTSCGHSWLPARDACPSCLAPTPQWQESTGMATLISWVIYHTAYHEAFKNHLPYIVACVELDEGPRMLTNLTGDIHKTELRIDAPLQLKIEYQGETALARFSYRPISK